MESKSVKGSEEPQERTRQWPWVVGSALVGFVAKRNIWSTVAGGIVGGVASLAATSRSEHKIRNQKASITIDATSEEIMEQLANMSVLAEVVSHLGEIKACSEEAKTLILASDKLPNKRFRVEISELGEAQEVYVNVYHEDKVFLAGEISLKAAPRKRGTEIHCQIQFDPSFTFSSFTPAIYEKGRADYLLRQILARFKQRLEVGEISTAQTRKSASGSKSEKVNIHRTVIKESHGQEQRKRSSEASQEVA